MQYQNGNRTFITLVILILLAIALPYSLTALQPYGLSPACSAQPHEMGVFSVDRKARVSFTESGLGMTYSVDFAPIPAADEIKLADANGDAKVDEIEKKIYLIGLARRVVEGLRLTINRQVVEIKPQTVTGDFLEDADGIKTVKAEILFFASFTKDWRGGSITIDDAVFSNRIGTRVMTLDPPPGWVIATEDGRLKDSTYVFEGPKGAGPWSARFELKPAGQASATQQQTSGAKPENKLSEATIKNRGVSTLALWALILAFVVGIGHSLTPGHGQALASAYLVGRRSTFRHAALLGWVVTAIRTTPVFALGIVALLADHYLLSDKSLWWLRLLSALVVAVIGVFIAVWSQREDVVKEQKAPTGMTTTELVGLGITSGLLPAPSALALLLGAFSFNQSALGLGLVVAFGFGLEAMMTLTGFFRVKAPSLADNIEDYAERMARVPLLWGVFVILTGIILLVHSVRM